MDVFAKEMLAPLSVTSIVVPLLGRVDCRSARMESSFFVALSMNLSVFQGMQERPRFEVEVCFMLLSIKRSILFGQTSYLWS